MVDITRLTGGNTPANGGDPRTFPAIWNATATSLESALAEAPVTVSATAPSSPSNGDLWWDTINLGLFMYYTGGETPEWIVAGGGGGGSIEISPTAPVSPSSGDMWWDSDNGNLYIYYDDGSSQQWVAANGPQVFVGTTAPAGYQGQLWFDSTSGKVYIYYDDGTSAQWVSAIGGSLAGSVLQVVSTTKTDAFSSSVSAGGNVAVTGLSITHALSNASNKLVLIANLGMVATTNGFSNLGSAFAADSTLIEIGDAAGSRKRVMSGTFYPTSQTYNVASQSIFTEYSPGDTASHTYTVNLVNASSSTYTLYANRSEQDSDSGTRFRGSSSFILMEVAG